MRNGSHRQGYTCIADCKITRTHASIVGAGDCEAVYTGLVNLYGIAIGWAYNISATEKHRPAASVRSSCRCNRRTNGSHRVVTTQFCARVGKTYIQGLSIVADNNCIEGRAAVEQVGNLQQVASLICYPKAIGCSTTDRIADVVEVPGVEDGISLATTAAIEQHGGLAAGDNLITARISCRWYRIFLHQNCIGTAAIIVEIYNLEYIAACSQRHRLQFCCSTRL